MTWHRSCTNPVKPQLSGGVVVGKTLNNAQPKHPMDRNTQFGGCTHRTTNPPNPNKAAVALG